MKHIFLVFGIVLICLNAIWAQEAYFENEFKVPTDANIFGHVTDVNGDHIPFATIMVLDSDKGTSADASGHYYLINLPEGKIILRARAVGFKAQEKEVTVEKGKTLEVNFQLALDVINAEGVVISASRYEQSRKDAPVIVNSIGPKLFDEVQAQTLGDGLNFTPGLRMENNCQNCGFSQLRMNGLDGPYSQFLINGRPIFSALNGVYGLEAIPPSMIQRVEVIRGGGSALYGSNAIAGTVNIITKDPIKNSWQIGSNFAFTDAKKADISVNANASVVSNDYSSGLFVYGVARERQPWDENGDGFSEMTKLSNRTMGARAFWKPGTRSRFNLDLNAISDYRRGGDKFDYLPSEAGICEMIDQNNLMGGLSFETFSADLATELSVYTSGQQVKRDSYYGAEQDPSAYGYTEGLTMVGGAQLTHHFADVLYAPGTITAGAEYSYDDLEDTKLGYFDIDSMKNVDNRLITDQRVNTIGAFAQYEWKSDNVKLLAGLRYDLARVSNLKHGEEVEEDYGNLSPRASVLINVNEHLQARMSFAGGFRVPQIFDEDLHIESSAARRIIHVLGDDLEPEKSNSFTAGLDYTQDHGKVQFYILAEGFYTELSNPFSHEYSFNEETKILTSTIVNAEDGAEVYGINLEARVAPSNGKISLQAGATIQQSEFKSPQEWGEDSTNITTHMLRTPSVYGYFTTNFQLTKKFVLSVSGVYTGPMYVPHLAGGEREDGSEIAEEELLHTKSFMDVNAKLTYDIPLSCEMNLQLYGGVQNIFNSYQDDFDYGINRDAGFVYGPSRPFTIMFGIKLGNMFL